MPALIILSVSGRPQAKGRPRFGRGHAYTPEATRNAEEIMRGEMRAACSTPLEGPLELMVTFRFRRPDSWPRAERERANEGYEQPHPGPPDLDNLLKTVLDAANGILWRNDAQIVELQAEKVYGAENETIINVSSVSASRKILEEVV